MSGRPDDRWFPHGPASRAVLIGTGRFTGLPAIPSVAANLRGLWAALTHPDHGLLAPEHCRVVPDPTDASAIGAALAWAVREAEEVLLVYYAGHGVLDDGGLLHLGLVHTDRDQVGFSAVPIELVKRHVSGARARARVLVVDCCFSGRAVSAMSDPADLAVGQLDLAGTYTLTSTTRTAPSHAPEGETYTAFTGALLDALAEPVPLTLDEVHGRVDRALHSRGLPRPQRRSAGAAGSLVLLRGPSGVPGAARAAGPTVPPPPRTPPPPPPPGAPPSFHLGAPVPPPRPARRHRPVLIATAVGGALAVLLTSSLVKGWFEGGDGGSGTASDGTVSGGTNTPGHTGGSVGGAPYTGPPGATSHAPRQAAAAKVVYRDRRVVWRAPSCTGSISQALDLDTPAVTAQTMDTSGSTTLDYIGCQNGLNGAQAVITLASSFGSPVRAGTADAGTNTGEACRSAAEGSPLGPNTNAAKVSPGTVWCVVTKLNQVARVTFSKVDTSDTSSGAGPGNPTFELTVTLWAAP
ncbi:caspase family protein [Streptomyces sp. WZ-12]|uniref:caspase family protein n=1 Tax=Streptomyces sp. WZ-12 TaxID=3030210 RepID=UPI002381357A|nr:caspase family protein [Streptomyces sp. WZ-12]